MVFGGLSGLGPSNHLPGISSGKGIEVVASMSSIVEALSVAGKLLFPPLVPAGNSSSANEGVPLSSLEGGSAFICLAFGDGQDWLGDVGRRPVSVLPSPLGSIKGLLDGMVGGVRSGWSGEMGSGEESVGRGSWVGRD